MTNQTYFTRLLFTFAAISVLFLLTPNGNASPILNPNNGHYYEAIYTEGITWHQADSAAQSQSFMGLFGHLATITSSSEQMFIFNNFEILLDEHLWLGGFQPEESPEPAGGWTWITGETFNFTNWGFGEPNNAGDENAVEFRSDGTWNDISDTNTFFNGGYIVEYDEFSVPVPIPSTFFLLGSSVIILLKIGRKKKRF